MESGWTELNETLYRRYAIGHNYEFVPYEPIYSVIQSTRNLKKIAYYNHDRTHVII